MQGTLQRGALTPQLLAKFQDSGHERIIAAVQVCVQNFEAYTETMHLVQL